MIYDLIEVEEVITDALDKAAVDWNRSHGRFIAFAKNRIRTTLRDHYKVRLLSPPKGAHGREYDLDIDAFRRGLMMVDLGDRTCLNMKTEHLSTSKK